MKLETLLPLTPVAELITDSHGTARHACSPRIDPEPTAARADGRTHGLAQGRYMTDYTPPRPIDDITPQEQVRANGLLADVLLYPQIPAQGLGRE
jgi:hypothetical protein